MVYGKGNGKVSVTLFHEYGRSCSKRFKYLQKEKSYHVDDKCVHFSIFIQHLSQDIFCDWWGIFTSYILFSWTPPQTEWEEIVPALTSAIDSTPPSLRGTFRLKGILECKLTHLVSSGKTLHASAVPQILVSIKCRRDNLGKVTILMSS